MISQIHQAGTRFVLAITGGGSGAISSLLTVTGASQSILLATVPYADAALVEWLGSRPEQFCAARTAQAMAMKAYQKAQQLDTRGGRLAGIGCTASLATDRPKLGPHRFYIATQSADETTCLTVELNKNQRSRLQEETIVELVILNEMATVSGLQTQLPIDWQPSEQPHRKVCRAPLPWQELLTGHTLRVCQNLRAENSLETNLPRLVFPGAFNPLHVGHLQMATIASQLLGEPVAFEISVVNVDKPPLDFLEIQWRTEQFAALDHGFHELWLTRAATFAEKATLFPGATFIVGTDTIARIAEPRYYANSIPQMLRSIESLALAGCQFLVFGRKDEADFCTVAELNIPPSLAALCQQVPESEFRHDISSTQLRGKSKRI